jgi:hypothetical protein
MLRKERATVTEQRERLERALRGCAEEGVPDGVDLWPAIRGRVGTETVPGERMTGEQVAPRRRVRPPQFVPNTPLGWTLAVLTVLIVAAGAYAASGPVGELLRYGLPGPGGPGVGGHTRGEQPDAELSVLRTEVDQTRTADGTRVTLDWAYADERFVAVGLHTRNLDDAQKPEGSNPGSDPVMFEPSLWDDTVGNEAEFPPHVEITDASGQDFDTVGGGTNGERADAAFDAPEGIKPGRGHRFRLEVPLEEVYQGEGDAPSGKPKPGPFAFVFEVPVLPAPTIRVGQEVEAEGITLTLERVVDSPLLPQAVVCFEPPDDEHSWTPWLKHDPASPEEVWSAPQRLEDGCWSLEMDAPVEGRSSVTVTHLEGFPRGPFDPGQTRINPKSIRGPWTFEFEAPGP